MTEIRRGKAPTVVDLTYAENHLAALDLLRSYGSALALLTAEFTLWLYFGLSGYPARLVLPFALISTIVFIFVVFALHKVIPILLALTGLALGGALSLQFAIVLTPTRMDAAYVGNALDWLFLVMNLALLCSWALSLLKAGFVLLRTRYKTRILLRDATRSTFDAAGFLLTIVGAPRACLWLPNVPRRLLTILLFALVTNLVAFLIFIGVNTVIVFPARVANLLIDLRDCRAADADVSCISAAFIRGLFGVIFVLVVSAILSAARYVARRLSIPRLNDVRARDDRPPILFLRSFADDHVALPRVKGGIFAILMQLGEPRPTLDHILLEEGIVVGPVQSVGKPGKAAPFGTPREFMNEDWPEAILERIDSAQCVVAVLGDTEGVAYELERIHSLGYAQKTLFVIPPQISTRSSPGVPASDLEAINRTLLSYETKAVLGDFRCVGWVRKDNGVSMIFVSAHPSVLTYRVLIRSFLRALPPS